MNNPILGPIGSLLGMGVSRLQRENEILSKTKLKRISNDGSAFNVAKPLNLRGNDVKKSINTKPTLNPVGKVSLRGSNSDKSNLDQLQLNNERHKVRKKKKVKDEEPTTATQTSSTTSSSTTSTSSTSTTPVTTSVANSATKVSAAQSSLKNEFQGENLVNAIGPANNSTNTSTSTNMAKNKDKGDRKFSSPLDITTAMGPGKYSDFSKPGLPEAVFEAARQTEPVKFFLDVPGTQHLNMNESTDLLPPEINPRFFINISSFSKALFNANSDSTLITNYNAEMAGYISDVFYRMNKDVVSNARSTISSYWSINYMASYYEKVARALEIICAYDSIVAYSPLMTNPYRRNDAVDEYQKLFYNTDLMNARFNLARRLKSCWFPPNYSQLIRWFYQTYRTSNLDQAAFYRYVPDGRFILNNVSGTGVGSVSELVSYFNTALTDLQSNQVQSISSICARLYPQGIIRNIPYACYDGVFDPVHFEIYTNCPVFWKTPQTTVDTDWACYPMTFGSATTAGDTYNDIPYYIATNPVDNDGFAYVMQTIIGNKSSSAFDIVQNTTSVVNTIVEGLHVFVPWQNAATTSSIATENIKNSNKWIFDHTSGKFIARCGNIQNAIAGNDATSVYAYTTTSSTTWNVTPISRPNTAHQRAYFNNRKGPALNRRLVFDKLFDIVN